jgi:SAM-dependent methyltransferase
MPLAFGPDESNPMVDTLLRQRVPQWQQLNRAIDSRDEMLLFADETYGFDRDLSLFSYFANGLALRDELRHIARCRFGDAPIPSFLDFASGYGRLTRFLVHEKMASSITVSDILTDAMEFQRSQFGVRTVPSVANAAEFDPQGSYDCIFVASLFTHLPPDAFRRWFRRLHESLRPEGLLVFSVHDESLAPGMVDQGIFFRPQSESRTLDPAEYGSTWVTEAFVRETVRAVDSGATVVRAPRAIAGFQDIYVVSTAPFELQPRSVVNGFLERCDTSADQITFSGWATAAGETCDRVEVRVGDRLAATTRDFHPRPDVAALLRTEASLASGWGCPIPSGAVGSFHADIVTVSAFSRSAIERILFLGTVETAIATVERRRANWLQEELSTTKATLAAEIAVMRQSYYWRVREQWWRLRRALGLG